MPNRIPTTSTTLSPTPKELVNLFESLYDKFHRGSSQDASNSSTTAATQQLIYDASSSDSPSTTFEPDAPSPVESTTLDTTTPNL
ncbi:hypothetical protein Tco_0140223 [Tanacetum coccineum]